MAQAQQQSGGQSPAMANAQLRSALLATAPRMRKNIGVFTAAPGTTSRLRLFNVGLLTMIQLLVSVSVTIGTQNATASPKAPWNIIQNIQLTDYDGTSRINMSGFQLFQINSIRYREPFGYNNSGASAIFTNPQQPLAVGNQTVQFMINVPIAFDPESDLRGMILAQTAVGEMYLNITWNANLITNASDDSLYNGGANTTVVVNTAPGISVQMWQHYLLPQPVGKNGQLPLPPLDLMTVYELAGSVISTDNIAAGQERLFNYPNVRTVIGKHISYTKTGTTLAGLGDLTQIRLIANGNNILLDYTEFAKYFEQRLVTHGDVVKGYVYLLHRNKPIETALFGNVQMGITPANAGAGSYFESLDESFYVKGTTLPGLQQAGG